MYPPFSQHREFSSSSTLEAVSVALFAATIFVALAACDRSPQRPEETAQPQATPPAPPAQGPAAFLPHPEIKGWRMSELLDADAERFQTYGLKQTAAAEYRRPQRAELSLRLEIFQLGDNLQAFNALTGQLAAFPRPENVEAPGVLEIRQAGLIAPGRLTFYKGDHLVRLILRDSSLSVTLESLEMTTRDLLPPVARELALALPGSSDLPEVLDALPRTRRVRRSERYHDRHLLGFDLLGAGVSALYGDPGPRFQVGVTTGLDAAGAQRAFDALAADLDERVEIEDLGEGALRGQLGDGRRIFLARRAEILALAVQPRDGDPPRSRTAAAILGEALDPELRDRAATTDPRPWLKRRRVAPPSESGARP